MNADAPDVPPDSAPWSGPIDSPLAFRRAVEDGLYEARRLADAHPSTWIYQTIAAILAELLQATAEGHPPEPGERQNVQNMLPTLRSQVGMADPALLRLTESVIGYFLEWPEGARMTPTKMART